MPCGIFFMYNVYMGKILLNIAAIFTDINKLRQISKLLKMSPKKIYEDFIKTPQKFAEKLGKMSRVQRQRFSEALGEAQTKAQESKKLSSSWIKRGEWTPVGSGSSGDLTIWTVKGKIGYTYPGVDYRIWTAMKSAKGKNGSGAGSVFWTMYLRSFKSSSFGQFLKRVQKLSGIKGIK